MHGTATGGGGNTPVGDISSTSSLLQEISSLRSRLRELEDDKSSMVSSAVDERDNPLWSLMKKDIAQLEQEKALQEKDFLNQMSSLQREHQSQLDELRDKVKKKDELNHIINGKLRKYVTERDELNVKLASTSEKVNESMAEINDLKEQLRIARMEGEMSRQKNDTEEKYLHLLEDARESHVKEIEQMKANLAASDVEIAESRGEIDHLQMELDELQSYREALLEEVTKVRLDLSDEKRTSQSLESELKDCKLKVARLELAVKETEVRYNKKCDEVNRLKQKSAGPIGVQRLQSEINEKDEKITKQTDEINEMKGAVEDLDSHKAALAAVVNDLKRQMNENLSKPLSVNTAPSTDDDDDEKPISPAEKDQLVKDMRGLEARLVRFHSKLADKECQIEELSASLKQEKSVNKQLRAEIKQLNADMYNSSAALRVERQRAQGGGNDPGTHSELAALRRQNKTLSDELEKLRVSKSHTVQSQASKLQSTSSRPNPIATRSGLCQEETTHRLVVPPPLKRTATLGGDIGSPRTPVSGLVASFERRIGSKSFAQTAPRAVEEVSPLPSPIETKDIQELLASEKQLVRALQEQLSNDKKTILELQEELRAAKKYHPAATNTVSRNRGQSPTDLATELRESQHEIEDLRAKIHEMEQAKAKHDAIVSSERAELTRLRCDASHHDAKRLELERKIADQENDVDTLRSELSRVVERNAHHEEKKCESDDNEVLSLRAVLDSKETNLALLRNEYETYRAATEEHVDRLNLQVEALESELEHALTKIEDLQHTLDNLNEVSIKDQQHARETMELELTMTKARHADLMNELNDKIKGLETTIDHLKKSKTDLSQAQHESEDEKKRLAAEVSSCQGKIADLESRIQMLDNALADEKKEKEGLRKVAATSEAVVSGKSDTEKKLSTEVNRLSFALTKAQMAKANSERENMEKLKHLENEVEALEIEANAELDKKCDEIDALKAALSRKEEEIERLEHERTQLCTSMNDVSFSRKDEMDELQAELLDMTMQTKTQAREIQMLKSKIEEYENRKEEASSKAQRRVRELETQITAMKESAAISDDFTQLKEENAQLRETIHDIKIERRQLKERLDALTQDKSASRSSQILRERNNVLKEEVEKLTKRLKKMEASITRFAI
jgi:chromosome segregation ATPase